MQQDEITGLEENSTTSITKQVEENQKILYQPEGITDLGEKETIEKRIDHISAEKTIEKRRDSISENQQKLLLLKEIEDLTKDETSDGEK